MLGLLRRLLTNERGNFAVVTALAIVPVAGLSGLAVDYSQAYSVRSTLQGEADAISLAVASEGPTGNGARFYAPMEKAAKDRVSIGTAQFTARWLSISDYEVVGTVQVPRSLSRLIPVGKDAIEVSSRSVARFTGVQLVYKTPARTMLDPEAGDYNRVYAYCFDREMAKINKESGRSQRTAIADNFDSSVYKDPIPQCKNGEVLSFELYNVRDSRTNKARWDDPKAERYSYHTDTNRDAEGRETYDLGGWAILETVLCPTMEACKNKVGNNGGILPHGKNRVPQRTSLACEPGKFMYYGWEDRPPGRGHSDKDYDDIRIIVECPVVEEVGNRSARLVH